MKLRTTAFIISVIGLILAVSACMPHALSNSIALQDDLLLRDRNLFSTPISVVNSDFEKYHSVDGSNTAFSGWSQSINTDSKARVGRASGYRSKTSLKLVMQSGENDADNSDEAVAGLETFVRISTPLFVNANYSVSAWVWADTPVSACIKITSDTGKEALSAFHSGNGTWEYLTVVYPYTEIIEGLQILLLTYSGTALFDQVNPLTISDDRFDLSSDDRLLFRFREHVAYRKGGRIRIVIVGNSTIWGDGSPKNASFPYVLQTKLESLYPGKFEVINYGICAWNIASQIVSLDKYFLFRPIWGGINPDYYYLDLDSILNGAAYGPQKKYDSMEGLITIKELDPDYIIMASMWNDIWRVTRFFRDGKFPDDSESSYWGSIPASVIYLRHLYAYVDNPVEKNHNAASVFKQQADKMQHNQMLFETYQDYFNSANFQSLEYAAEAKFTYLMDTFLSRSRSWTNVWLATLPSRYGRSYESVYGSLIRAKYVDKSAAEAYKIHALVDSSAEEIQNRVTSVLADKYFLPFINFSVQYRQLVDRLTLNERNKLQYFKSFSDWDNVHLLYRGNEWLADTLFMQMKDKFQQIAENQ